MPATIPSGLIKACIHTYAGMAVLVAAYNVDKAGASQPSRHARAHPGKPLGQAPHRHLPPFLLRPPLAPLCDHARVRVMTPACSPTLQRGATGARSRMRTSAPRVSSRVTTTTATSSRRHNAQCSSDLAAEQEGGTGTRQMEAIN
jgi:hypothetical protein